jgi:SPP1 gp7 family putative phage head morphogenesis protein
MPETFGNIVFAEAIAFLRDRLALPEEVWEALVAEADAAAATRSRAMSLAMHRDLLAAILAAFEDGSTWETFKATFDAVAAARGWKGEDEGGWRSQLIFRTMTAQAVAAGRWRQIQRLKRRAPWLRYVTAGDHRVRREHAAWHGLVLAADDPWWQTHFPPNGFNCRCHVMQLSDFDLERFGWTPGVAPPASMQIRFVRVDGVLQPVETPAGIDPGFAFNAGELGLRLHELAGG